VRWVRRLTVVVLTALAAAPAAHAATIPVTTTADGVANEGLCSLREAVSAAGVTVIDTLRGDRAFDVFQGIEPRPRGAHGPAGRSAPGGPGGAIRNQGTLIIVRSSFEGNATGDGADPPSREVSAGRSGAAARPTRRS
jgi:CSLREA domain-containing protein